MPLLLRARGYRFHFFSNEGEPREPPHVHVQKGRQAAKFWLNPGVRLDESVHLSAGELRKIEQVVKEQQSYFLRRWHEHFS